jgi:hypothetical protein
VQRGDLFICRPVRLLIAIFVAIQPLETPVEAGADCNDPKRWRIQHESPLAPLVELWSQLRDLVAAQGEVIRVASEIRDSSLAELRACTECGEQHVQILRGRLREQDTLLTVARQKQAEARRHVDELRAQMAALAGPEILPPECAVE